MWCFGHQDQTDPASTPYTSRQTTLESATFAIFCIAACGFQKDLGFGFTVWALALESRGLESSPSPSATGTDNICKFLQTTNIQPYTTPRCPGPPQTLTNLNPKPPTQFETQQKDKKTLNPHKHLVELPGLTTPSAGFPGTFWGFGTPSAALRQSRV